MVKIKEGRKAEVIIGSDFNYPEFSQFQEEVLQKAKDKLGFCFYASKTEATHAKGNVLDYIISTIKLEE